MVSRRRVTLGLVSISGLVGTIGVLGGQAGTSPVTTMQGARRSWSADEKRRIVEESFRPGASVAVVARRHDLNANLLFTWRRQVRPAEPAAGPPAVAAPEPAEFVPIDRVVRPLSAIVPGSASSYLCWPKTMKDLSELIH